MKHLLFSLMILLMQSAIAQKNSLSDKLYSENYAGFKKSQTLLVIMQNPDEKVLQKLAKNSAALTYYKNFIQDANETLLNAVQENWKLNGVIEAKTLDEIIELEKSSNASDYIVIGTVYQTTTTTYNPNTVTGVSSDKDYYYENPISAQSVEFVVKNWKTKSDPTVNDSIFYLNNPDVGTRAFLACMQLENAHITHGFNDKAGWTTLGWIEQSKQLPYQYEMDVYVKYIAQFISEAIADHSKTEEIFYTQNASELKTKKLVITEGSFAKLSEMPKRLQDDITSKTEFGTLYPYEYKIVSDAEWQKIATEQEEGYACLMFTALRAHTDLYIFDASTHQMIICTRPALKITNDYSFANIRDQQVNYILDAINGVVSE